MSRHLSMFNDVHWTIAGFVIFVVLFVFFVASTYFPSQIALMKKLERLPLEDESRGEKV